MPYVNIPESTLATSLGTQLSKLESSFTSKVKNSVLNIEKIFKNGCPSPSELNNIKSQLNNLKIIVTNVQNRVNRVKSVVPPLRRASRAIFVGATVLKALPIPGLTLTAGATTTFADTLHTVKEFSTQLNENANSIEFLLNNVLSIDNLIEDINSFSKKVDRALEFCSICSQSSQECPKDCISKLVTGTSEEITQCTEDLNTILNTNLRIAPSSTTESLENEIYKNYVIKIIEVPSDFSRAKLRQAVAEDSKGIIYFKSNKSFSSSVEVLKKEVKFLIDTQIFYKDREESNTRPENFFTSKQFSSRDSFDEFTIYKNLNLIEE